MLRKLLRSLPAIGISISLMTLFSVGSGLPSEDPLRAIDKKWEAMSSQLDQEWNEMERIQQEEWNRFKAEVEQKWQVFAHSTKKDWVTYNPKKEARSQVDFKEGKVVFEAVVPESDPRSLDRAKAMIEQQITTTLSQSDLAGKRVLENQIASKSGVRVSPEVIKKFAKEEILPNVKPDPVSYESRDGVKRKRYAVEINMVPEHIRIRAEKYLPLIVGTAERFRLTPQLILAIIHTESYFNPKAVSSCDAIGIMQIIPKHAGREAYQFVYGTDKVINREYLFNPVNNIELGSAYLHLLKYRHFADIQAEVKNHYIVICGYNWGPTSMRSRIVDRYPISRMSDEEVYSLLRQKTPEETRDYIQKVRERMPLYDPFFSRG
jgi:membrane-bound lytic murein transglycosylase C